MSTFKQEQDQLIVENAQKELIKSVKETARDYTDKYADHNDGIDAMLKMMKSLPKTDRHCAKFAKGTFLQNYIYISFSERSGSYFHYDGVKWNKIQDHDFGAYIGDAYELFFNELEKGYKNLFKHLGIPLIAPSTKKSEGEDGDDEEKEVPLTPEERKQASARANLKSIQSITATLAEEKSYVNLLKATRGAIHKPKSFFNDDSRYIVAKDGWVLETNNLSAGWQAPDKSRPILRTSGVVHNGQDENPELWQKYLDTWFQGEDGKEYQRYLQIATGCALLGRGDTRQVPSLYGLPRTGKSTFVKTLMGIFGGYGVTVNRDFLTGKNRFSRAAAQGARYLLLEETDKFEFADTGFIKQIAGGGGTLRSERKGIDSEEWPIQFVLFIATNNRIKIDTSDNAGVERIDYVEFKHRFEVGADGFVKNLEKELLEKCPNTIFNWILEGAKMWDDGTYQEFPRPDSMFEQDNESRKEQSTAIEWLDDALTGTLTDPVHGTYGFVRAEINEPTRNCVKNTDAYNRYKWWATAQGHTEPMKIKPFYEHITSYLNCTIKKSGNDRFITGLKFASTQESSYFKGQVEGHEGS